MDTFASGPVGNRNKKRDHISDTIPSFKHDTEADIGEFFYSRETLKLSYKKDIGQFVRFGEAPASSALPYKVFTAILWQTGVNSVKSVGNSSGGAFKQVNTFDEGASYEIVANPNNTDLSLLGAPNNLVGTKFISILGVNLNDYNLDVDVVFSYNQGAPKARVLENTLETNIYFDYSDMGNYLAIADTTLFGSPYAYVTITNSAFVFDGDSFVVQATPIFYNVASITSTQNGYSTDGVMGNFYAPTILEIRIYNDTVI